MARHGDLVTRAAASPLVSHRVLGQTLDGQDMDLLEISANSAPAPLKIWFIARQHPGETMAEWWMEGFLERILDPADPVSRTLLARCDFYLVPNMNPDGSRRGHLRTNAAGMNLNREWNAPSMEKSPEVFLVRQAMHETGVDFHMDVHGDEALSYNFIAGFEGVPSVTDKQLALLDAYMARLAALSPDFQTKVGYAKDAPGSADMRKCTDYVAENFGCLSMTLEMPFKDNADLPEPLAGWSPARCRLLARSCIDALHGVVGDLG
jgi:murein tripeptide amidase MpaA